jgi:hypothetical protein
MDDLNCLELSSLILLLMLLLLLTEFELPYGIFGVELSLELLVKADEW